jgi:hypothetical protein
MPTFLVGDQTKQMERAGMIRSDRQELTVTSRSVGQLAGPVMPHAEL